MNRQITLWDVCKNNSTSFERRYWESRQQILQYDTLAFRARANRCNNSTLKENSSNKGKTIRFASYNEKRRANIFNMSYSYTRKLDISGFADYYINDDLEE